MLQTDFMHREICDDWASSTECGVEDMSTSQKPQDPGARVHAHLASKSQRDQKASKRDPANLLLSPSMENLPKNKLSLKLFLVKWTDESSQADKDFRKAYSRGMRARSILALGMLLILILSLLGTTLAVARPVLQVVYPYRRILPFAPAWFGTMVLPAGKATLEVQYAGDACESLLGRIAVRDKVVLVDRGKCSFLQKVGVARPCSCRSQFLILMDL
jgi:hypothetical protein